jgi:hypothetical protein
VGRDGSGRELVPEGCRQISGEREGKREGKTHCRGNMMWDVAEKESMYTEKEKGEARGRREHSSSTSFCGDNDGSRGDGGGGRVRAYRTRLSNGTVVSGIVMT